MTLDVSVDDFTLDYLDSKLRMYAAQNNANPDVIYMSPDLVQKFCVLTGRGTDLKRLVQLLYKGILISSPLGADYATALPVAGTTSIVIPPKNGGIGL